MEHLAERTVIIAMIVKTTLKMTQMMMLGHERMMLQQKMM